jgi:hypothetical protein
MSLNFSAKAAKAHVIRSFLWGIFCGPIIFPASEHFGRAGRKVLERVGNTARLAVEN